MTATLGGGSYAFHCRMSGQAVMSSATVNVTGQGRAGGPGRGRPPVTVARS